MEATEVVLITGGAGFLGQHIVKLLQERDAKIKEIRIVDLKPYENFIGHSETKKITSYVGDICEPEKINHAFIGVDVVFHLASYINFDFPPNYDQLKRVNVDGTQNIINLCVKHNIPRLIYTSTALLHMTPYMGANFTVICNQTEPKTYVPQKEKEFQIPGFPSSKAKAENLVLKANGMALANSNGTLSTIALRPPIIFGEGDQRYFTTIIKIGVKFNGKIPKIAGPGGKQQTVYAGNAAWGHICAKDAMAKTSAKNIVGLPVFITDDSGIEDITRFCQRVSRANDTLKLGPSNYQIPLFITYFLAFLLELFVKFFGKRLNIKLSFPPCGLLSYMASIILFNRLRASIYLDYDPIFKEDDAVARSAKWYEKWYQDYCQNNNIKKLKVK